jgi:hypothetical protein
VRGPCPRQPRKREALVDATIVTGAFSFLPLSHSGRIHCPRRVFAGQPLRAPAAAAIPKRHAAGAQPRNKTDVSRLIVRRQAPRAQSKICLASADTEKGFQRFSAKAVARSGGNHAWLCNPNPCRRGGDLFQRTRRCIGTGGDNGHATGLASCVRTFDPRHFNCHQLYAVMQFAGGELSNRLFYSSTACTHRDVWPFQRTLSSPYTERDGECSLRVGLHFDATCVSDELRPTILHTRTIARCPGPCGGTAPASKAASLVSKAKGRPMLPPFALSIFPAD